MIEPYVKLKLLKVMETLGDAINANCDRRGRKGNKDLGVSLRAIDSELDAVFDDFDEDITE